MDFLRRPATSLVQPASEKTEPSFFDSAVGHVSSWLGLGAASAADQAAAFPHLGADAKEPPSANENAPSAPKTKKQVQLGRVAERLEKAQQHGLFHKADKTAIIAELSQLSPEDAAEVSKIYGEKFAEDGKARSLQDELGDVFDAKSKETKFIGAVMGGKKDEAQALGIDVTVDYLRREVDAKNTDEGAMNDLIRANAKDPMRAAKLQKAYADKTGQSLTAVCETVMNDAELKEVNANLSGDRVTANVAMLEQGKSDRVGKMLEDVGDDPAEIARLARATQEQTGRRLETFVDWHVDANLPVMAKIVVQQNTLDAARAEKRAADTQHHLADLSPDQLRAARANAERVASRLSAALGKPDPLNMGMGGSDVTEALRGLDPGEVSLVMEEYKKQAASLGHKDADLEADLRHRLKGKDLKIANAVMGGDKELAAVGYVEQAADGPGTDVIGWRTAMSGLDTGDAKADDASRARFHALMNKHAGVKSGAYDTLVKSETSGFERDELAARGQINSDLRAADLAQVNLTKNAYGGKITQIVDGLEDSIGDVVGETDEQRNQRRIRERESGAIAFSNLGGSDDAQLDALASLKNDTQRSIFELRMKQRVGKSSSEVVKEEMGVGIDGMSLPGDKRRKAGLAYAEGDYEGGTAMRMVSELDDYRINDRENQASLGFEQVRLAPDQEWRINALPEEKRAEAREAEMATARNRLLSRADDAAGGKGEYQKLLKQELSTNEVAVAEDRIASGKATDMHRLRVAGDGVFDSSLGVDSGTITEVLGDKSPEQVRAIDVELKAATKTQDRPEGVGLSQYLAQRADSAGQRRDFAILAEGNYGRMKPEELQILAQKHPEILSKRVKDLERAAHGGSTPDGNGEMGNSIMNFITDLFTGGRVNDRLDRVEALDGKIQAKLPLTAEEQKDLIDQTRYMSGDQQSFTETKSNIVNTGAEVVGTGADIGATALTGDQTIGSLANGQARGMVKSTFDPGRYGTNAQYRDTVQTLTDATGNMIGTRLENSPLLSRVTGGVGGGLAQGLSDPRDLVDGGNFVEKAGTGAIDQTTSSLATGGMEDKLGKGLGSKMAQSVVRTAITGDYDQSVGSLAKETGKSGFVDWARTSAAEGHNAREANKKANEPPPTPVGGEGLAGGAENEPHVKPVETGKSESVIVPETPAPKNPIEIENSARTTERVNAALAAMPETQRNDVMQIVNQAQTPQQQALFERAIAAGNTPLQLDRLRVAMKNVPDAQLGTEFTGNGMNQLFVHSCVPTTAQSSLADVDPMYAFELRNNPVKMLEGQRAVLQQSGAQQIPRSNVDSHSDMFNDPVLRKALANTAPVSEGLPGVHGVDMKNQPVQKKLENATGSSFDVLTSENLYGPTAEAGDGRFKTLPHDRIAEATMNGLPVTFGAKNHQRTIIDTQVLPDGTVNYLVRDPLRPREVMSIPRADLDKFPDVFQTISLPKASPTATEKAAPKK